MKTNSLKYNDQKFITYNGKKATLYIKIRLNDECKNGHQDFSITGDIYSNQTGAKSDIYFLDGGCIHNEISKHMPQFKQFINLHLCDYSGAPMHPSANGFYHIKQGFNNTEAGTEETKKEYCEYYRVTPSQYDKLYKSENEIEFSILLDQLGILKSWNEEAKEAIKELEKLTGNIFVNDSKRSHHTPPTAEQISDFKAKQKNGYYTDENKKIRAKAKLKADNEKKIEKLKAEAQKKIDNAKNELNTMLLINKKGLSLDNVIYYSHTNTISFNWKSYETKITEEQFNKFIKSITKSEYKKLHKDIKFELSKE